MKNLLLTFVATTVLVLTQYAFPGQASREPQAAGVGPGTVCLPSLWTDTTRLNQHGGEVDLFITFNPQTLQYAYVHVLMSSVPGTTTVDLGPNTLPVTVPLGDDGPGGLLEWSLANTNTKLATGGPVTFFPSRGYLDRTARLETLFETPSFPLGLGSGDTLYFAAVVYDTTILEPFVGTSTNYVSLDLYTF